MQSLSRLNHTVAGHFFTSTLNVRVISCLGQNRTSSKGLIVSYLNRQFVPDRRSGYNLGFESITHIMQQNGYAQSEQQYGGDGGGERLGA